jgi:rhodanese-related sulfurtransferase
MNLIERDELKQKIDRGDDFKLVMAMSEWQFAAMHIPGSLCMDSPEAARDLLLPTDEIVVYCSNVACRASAYAYEQLKDNGFDNVRRYAGGIVDWSAAGYPIEGSRAAAPA